MGSSEGLPQEFDLFSKYAEAYQTSNEEIFATREN